MASDEPVLIAEDSEDDILFLRRAFRRAGIKNPVREVPDGQQAIQYLEGQGQYSDRKQYPLPCVIITDLKMPNVDGFGLLRWLRDRPEFNPVPKLVLSGSDIERDRQQAAELGACGYFVKPNGFDTLVKVVADIDHEWISTHCPLADPADRKEKASA
jgi:CheY-like chemotaxis protein